MKKLALLTLVLSLLLSLFSCSLLDIDLSELGSQLEGLITEQLPESGLEITGENGYVGQLGGKWPDNEFTRMIPVPSFDIFSTVSTDASFMASFTGVSLEDTKNYARSLSDAGFRLEEETSEKEQAGISLYSFSAKNEEGYRLSLSYTMKMLTLNIIKPLSETK